MSRIRILPEILSNQIAAGEVVQRPVSVVKELVENSMDAGADRISVEIEKGGKSLIRISDNGSGLSRDEAMLAIERYATSKIYSKEDLFSISTFGFRGEALPSIASVSKFTLVSRQADSDIGTRIDITGGKLSKVSDAGAPPGTMVEIKHLFFNTPARRKFLKTENTEASHISDAMSGLAMGNPSIGFRLFFNKKLVKHFPPGQTLFQRAQMVLGRDAADSLYELEWPESEESGVGPKGNINLRIYGVCANPAVTRSTANRIYLFVNNRLVYDRGLVAAIFQGYRGRIMKGKYPVGVVCVDLPYDQVDVNVHPAKREIKFISPQPVYQAVTKAVIQALADAQTDTLNYSQTTAGIFKPDASIQRGRGDDLQAADRANGEAPDHLFSQPKPSPKKNEAKNQRLQSVSDQENYSSPDPVSSASGVAQPTSPWQAVPVEKESFVPQVDIPKDEDKNTPNNAVDSKSTTPQAPFVGEQIPPKVIGQVLGTYIVVEKDHHLVLVDQHAAHERIVYERLKRRHRSLNVQSQSLMVPEILELTHREADLLESIREELSGFGLNIEPFGGTTFIIKSVPVLVEEKAVRQMIMEMVEQLNHDNGTGSKDDWLDNCLITMACHRAIRANQSMSHSEMVALINELFTCENPMHCPHGRPILISFDSKQLEKLFKRLV
ncbi:MAG: DNA mismatch repair endonuclease MutL [Desulfobacterales bacterium]|nr:DNA mismatch repair endonuclease MutL [Desulfobacterales bacterium]